ncbi:hypothetical protein BGW42_000785 [Actinomortierella wolfii]|nr:hypothetical protein BGW42_000785 [Actinomortierella wolfii]
MSRLPRELYIEQRSIEEYDAIDFFDFGAFTSDQKQAATFTWKSFVLPHVQQKDLTQYNRLVTIWNESKSTRQKYWDNKRKMEAWNQQLDDYIDSIRSDTIIQTQLVSNSITRDVGDRIQCLKHNRTPQISSPLTDLKRTRTLQEVSPSSTGLKRHTTPQVSSTLAGSKRTMAPETKASRKLARREISKTKIKEPWHTLIEAALMQYNDCQVDLPDVGATIYQESDRRFNLYQVALRHLDDARTRQVSFDRASRLEYKDAFVALSGIWNTYSSHSNELFGQSLTEEVKALCYLPLIDEKDDALVQITNSLLQKQTLAEILEETYKLQSTHPTCRRMLDVLRIIGEQGCSASALSKSKLADIFETGTMPRMSAVVFRVKKWHDIWVAGNASQTIVLPSSLDELLLFLEEPVHRLAQLLNHYHEYAAQAYRMHQKYQYHKKGEDEEDAVSCTSQNGIETLEREEIVFHTPTMAARRPSMIEKLQHVKNEEQHDS